MKKTLIFMITILLVLNVVIWGVYLTKKYSKEKILDWKEYNLVMHAFGGIDGLSCSNSREAFIENYLLGCRVFEVDLYLTSDDKVVAIHHPELTDELIGIDLAVITPTMAEILNSQIYGYLTPLSFDDIIDLMIEHPDMYIITDTKFVDKESIQKQFSYIFEIAKEKDLSVLKRVIPQLYHLAMYDYVEEIYRYDEYIFTLYQLYQVKPITWSEIFNFLSNHPKIKGLGIDKKHMTPETASELTTKLKELNVLTYAHTLNDIEFINILYNAGVWGFYTDFITEDYLKQNNVLRYNNM